MKKKDRCIVMRKRFKMKNAVIYFLAVAIAIAPVMVIPACTKKPSGSADLIGNWSISDYFDGPARSEAVTFTINDIVYLGTGVTSNKILNDFWKYSPDQKYWVQIADFKGGIRSSGIAFAINGMGYAGLGYDGENYLKDMWQYSPDSNGWARKHDFGGTPRIDAVAFVLNNNGYVATGYDDNYLKDNWKYDPVADTWTQKAGIAGAKRKEAAVFILNNQAYVVSGNNNTSALNDLEVYDANADKWTTKRKLTNVTDSGFDDQYTSIARWNAVAFTMNDKAYLATGENGSMNTHTWEYDYTTDLWKEKTGFEGSARTGAAAFTLKNRGFVLTGRNGPNVYDNMFEFQPDVPVNNNDNY